MWIVILAVPALVIGFFGYRWIHATMQTTAVVVGISLVVMLIQGLRHGSLPASETTLTAPHAGLFLAGVALLVIDMLSFGPFVVGLHPLPAGRRQRDAAVLGYLQRERDRDVHLLRGRRLPRRAAARPSDPVTAIGRVSGRWALLVMALSLINGTTINAYTGSFQIISFAGMWRRFRPESAAVRIIPFTVIMAIGVVVAVLGYQHFVSNLSNLLDDLLLVFIPWSAVNLTDYFAVRHGRYDVAAFFDPSGGPYGKVAWRGIARRAGRVRRRVAVHEPARLHRPARVPARRRRHLLDHRLDRRGRRLPAPGLRHPPGQQTRPADRRPGRLARRVAGGRDSLPPALTEPCST